MMGCDSESNFDGMRLHVGCSCCEVWQGGELEYFQGMPAIVYFGIRNRAWVSSEKYDRGLTCS